jgi:hypothetical protein
MRKIKEVLRLRFALGLGQREIARACSISQGAVHNYLKKAAGAGMQWPLPEGWDEKQIEEAVFGKQRSIEESSPRAFPDFPALHRELSFLDRLALLIDQQWNWRENQALTRRVKAARLRGAACVEDIDYRVERGLNKSVIRGLAQESGWVKNHEHIFVLGPTGVGKSYVASRHWRRKLAGMAIRFTTPGRQRCSAI